MPSSFPGIQSPATTARTIRSTCWSALSRRSSNPGDEASYHQVCFDRLQRYQVIKQADTLLLITRLPEQFTEEEKLGRLGGLLSPCVSMTPPSALPATPSLRPRMACRGR